MSKVPRQFALAKYTPRGSHLLRRQSLRDEPPRWQTAALPARRRTAPGFWRRRPDVHSSRAIRTITGEYNTKIADHEPAPGNACGRSPAVHNRRARSGSEDGRKRHAFGSGTAGLVLHRRRDFDFTHAWPNFPASYAEKTGAQFNCAANALDLGSVLHHASALDERRRGTQADFRSRSQDRCQPVAHAGSNRLGFDAHGSCRSCPSLRGQPLRSRQQRGLARR